MSKYNGYTNYETWSVNLWLSNDESIYSMIHEWIDDRIKEYDPDDKGYFLTTHDYFRSSLGDYLKDWFEDMRDEMIHDSFEVFNDLLQAALDKVDWYEIAELWLEGYEDQIAALDNLDYED